MWRNSNRQLFLGDNLIVMQRDIPDECVDLIYLDPPFNSGKKYNLLIPDKYGRFSPAANEAYMDSWKWDEGARKTYDDILLSNKYKSIPNEARELIKAWNNTSLKGTPLMAYLVMMMPRLAEMKRVLKKSGCIYLHCDPTASHYLKIIMDTIFGMNYFRNEIIWHYEYGSRAKKGFGSKHDVILLYSKSKSFYWNDIRVPHLPSSIKVNYRKRDENGRLYREGKWKSGKVYRYYADDGRKCDDVWVDISSLHPSSKERHGYPTEKPEELLERIIKASCPHDGVMLDSFCGCGTSVAVAERLGIKWIGIDINYPAIGVIKQRLKDNFPGIEDKFVVDGTPNDIESAREFALKDRYQFQTWVIDMLDGNPGKKGADGGVDGKIFLKDEFTKQYYEVYIQVKSGHVGVKDIREMDSIIRRDNYLIGVLATLEPPTKVMENEIYKIDEPWVKISGTSKQIPKIQIITVEDILYKRMSIKYPENMRIPIYSTKR